MSRALGFQSLHAVDPVVTLHADGATTGMACAVADVVRERQAQIVKWGDDSMKDHPDGTGGWRAEAFRDLAQVSTDTAAERHTLTWRHILQEEVAEAFAETTTSSLRAELVQVAAVAVKWIEAIDRRNA